MRALIGLVVGAWVAFSAVPALACGEWHMTDSEKKLDVDYVVNAARIKKGDKNYASIYLDVDMNGKQPLRVVRDKKVVFDIKNGKLLKLGQVVGTIDKSSLTIGKKTFVIQLRNVTSEVSGPSGYAVEVHDGDKVVLTSENAYPMCTGGGREEIMRRIVYYLAWRELGG